MLLNTSSGQAAWLMKSLSHLFDGIKVTSHANGKDSSFTFDAKLKNGISVGTSEFAVKRGKFTFYNTEGIFQVPGMLAKLENIQRSYKSLHDKDNK